MEQVIDFQESVLNNDRRRTQRLQVNRRIQVDHNHVGQHAGFDLAKFFLLQNRGGNDRGTAKHVFDWHSVGVHQFQLARIFTVSEHADVAAAGNRDSGCDGVFHQRFCRGDSRVIGIRGRVPAAVSSDRFGSHQSWAQHDTLFTH